MPGRSLLAAATPRAMAVTAATFAALSVAACISSDKLESSNGSSASHEGGAASSAGAGDGGRSASGTGSSEPSAGDPCAGSTDKAACGADLGGAAEHLSAYTCSGGSTASAVGCEGGCSGGACLAPPADPCGSAEMGSGLFCGGTLTRGDKDALYTCQDGTTASKKSCAAGCKVNAPGTADGCNPVGDPCAGASLGDGVYCGASLAGSIGDPGVLYQCKSKKTVSQTICAVGCQVNPPMTPDVCKPTGGGQCCVMRPPGALLQPYSACDAGGKHHGRDHGAAIGTQIYAGIAGTVVGTATGLPGCYNNGCSRECSGAFNYIKIKADCGDVLDPLKDLYIYYLHIDGLAPGIEDGSHVDQGQLVAFSGSSGCSSVPHIHIETVSVNEGGDSSLNTCASVDPKSRYCK